MDSWLIDLQEGLVILFSPVLWGAAGVVVIGGILAALIGFLLDTAGLFLRKKQS